MGTAETDNVQATKDEKAEPWTIPGFERVEFHRGGLALKPKESDLKPGVAVLLTYKGLYEELRSCSCLKKKKRTCSHVLELAGLYKSFLKASNGREPHELFLESPWYKLVSILGDQGADPVESVRVKSAVVKGRSVLLVINAAGEEAARYFSGGEDAVRLVDRLGYWTQDSAFGRRALVDRLANMTLTDQERVMVNRGFKSFRLLLEGSVWYRLGYHAFREFGSSGLVFEPGIDLASGDFTISCRRLEKEPFLRLTAPRKRVKALLNDFGEYMLNQGGLAIHPVPLKSIFKISRGTELDLEIQPMVKLLQEGGEEQLIAGEEFERFRYGDLVYLKSLGLMAELERAGGRERKFHSPIKMVLKKSQVPAFLEEHDSEIKEGRIVLEPDVKGIRVFKTYDRVVANPEALDRDWCWLDVSYGFGSASVSLGEIIEAQKEGRRYISTAEGWVDCQAEDIAELIGLASGVDGSRNRLRMSRLELLRLSAVSKTPVEVAGDEARAGLLKKFWELQPSREAAEPAGLASPLRTYQGLGLQWLLFLFENKLGGLLCDEMGLGKTHQAMALMLLMKEGGDLSGPVLVVCPTTVLSHWRDKMRQHAPGMKCSIYHGAQRDLKEALSGGDALITSYGILLQDVDRLAEVDWSLAVFDEMQQVKNKQTQTYVAAGLIKARMKLGLTGTPVENRLQELKALFDLVLPGYLGNDQDFKDRYLQGSSQASIEESRRKLGRMISPFILRRLKKTVLTELPAKIEDIRTCRLSEEQVGLYREAVESRGRGLIRIIEEGREPVPYIHIFALLGLLKQICDHPALAAKEWERYEEYESGKWDLFKEMLDECLDGGEKVVVYSQYLDMIRIIEHYLESLGVGCAVLTGQSRNRGEIVRRFDEDPDCRVFVGSLKAGGLGIDLVAASVVIHYDRWWNAAREDQATDRVHRIGQRQGVQVFKLMTEGTLEEKIAAIIDKKKELMESVVAEDDPGLLKTFSKNELADLMSF